jgi:GTP-binding protein
MVIKSAEFIISNSSLSDCPNDNLPEYAFIGRSNVGKSSLINMLTNVGNLAKTSVKPGKTLLINHFLINKEWYLVDLPGYGFAKISQKSREKLHKMITDYVTKREQLANLFVLVDSRHNAFQIDLDFIDYLGENGIPFSIVFTKTDKITQSDLSKNLKSFKTELEKNWETAPPIFMTSSEKGRGREELLDYIDSINKTL